MLDARPYKMLTSFDLVGLLSLIQTYCRCPGLPPGRAPRLRFCLFS